MIIFAIGFSVEKYVWPADYVGRDGTHLQDRWGHDGVRAYLGMMVPDFPNFFMYGPNSQNASGGGAGLPTQIEMWAGYIATMIMASVQDDDPPVVEVTRSAYESYNERLDEAASGLIWMVDKSSFERNYYVIGGRLQVNIPWRHLTWHKMLTAPVFDDLAFIIGVAAQNCRRTGRACGLSARKRLLWSAGQRSPR
jgi:4-hydroxyacetophenone monooxygenase